MAFEIKIQQDKAEAEIEKLLDAKSMFPKQKARIQMAVDVVVEAMMYGFVKIEEDGKITQDLYTPVGTITQLVYQSRIEPLTMNKNLKNAKAETAGARNMVYICSYTGQLSATIDKLEPADRNIAEAISFFFQ